MNGEANGGKGSQSARQSKEEAGSWPARGVVSGGPPGTITSEAIDEPGDRTSALGHSGGVHPLRSHRPEPQLASHEAACILNPSDEGAHLEITVFFVDREPLGPCRPTVPPRRMPHQQFNGLEDPKPIPENTARSSVIESDVPVVVRHTRLDSRQAENALLSTIAFASDD